MKNYTPKLFIFTGPSGVGKGTVLRKFFDSVENIIYSISYTTRAPRVGEQDGVHYFFTKKEDFEDLIKKNSFLEYAQYSGNYYGTNKDYVFKKLNEGKSVLLEIELQGALSVMEKCSDAVSIFIKPPDFSELERRLRGRNSEDEATIQKRLKTAEIELQNADKFKYVIVNDEIERAKKELVEIYYSEVNS